MDNVRRIYILINWLGMKGLNRSNYLSILVLGVNHLQPCPNTHTTQHKIQGVAEHNLWLKEKGFQLGSEIEPNQ